MAQRAILDASATLAWLFNEDDKGPALLPLLRDHDLVAPSLWKLEVTNAILVRERRKIITAAQGEAYLNHLASLDVEIIAEPTNRSISELAKTARPYQLSSYDAVYLDLAMRLQVPILTMDGNLKDASKRVGLKVLP